MKKTKDLIKLYYDSFNNKDIQTLLNLLDENVTHDINQDITEIGKKAFSDFMANMDCYDEVIKDILIMTNEDGTRASAEFFVEGCYIKTDQASGMPAATGQQYGLKGGTFFSIKEGKISRVTVYYNLKNWLEQVSSK